MGNEIFNLHAVIVIQILDDLIPSLGQVIFIIFFAVFIVTLVQKAARDNFVRFCIVTVTNIPSGNFTVGFVHFTTNQYMKSALWQLIFNRNPFLHSSQYLRSFFASYLLYVFKCSSHLLNILYHKLFRKSSTFEKYIKETWRLYVIAASGFPYCRH